MRLYFKNYFGDKYILFSIFLLFIIGLTVIFSVTESINDYSPFFIKQCIGFIAGIILIFFLSITSYKDIVIWGTLIHILTIILLILTLLIGHSVMGGQRWINLGIFKLQPAELSKITLPLFLVNYFYNNILKSHTHLDWIKLLIFIALTSLLIIKQPDLGSGLIVGISSFLLLYISGLPRKIIIYLCLMFIFSTPILWFKLHDYQKKRILVFLGEGDRNKERYQLEQSKIAIGSGGITGKGFLNGTQKNFKFLPENRTDFIFSILAEEFGFIGVFLTILIYLFIIIRYFILFSFIDDEYAYMLCIGSLFPFIVSIIFNIGMIVGLFPVVGVPLPCISCGMAHIISTCISFGIINSVLSECDK